MSGCNVWHVYIRSDGSIATPEDIAKERAAKRAEEERKRREAEEREIGRPRADILPCPFCGGEARIQEDRSRAEEGTVLYAVSCIDKDCPGYSFRPDGDAPEDEDAAVRKWNRRRKKRNAKGGKA